jgi:hypothetical protein
MPSSCARIGVSSRNIAKESSEINHFSNDEIIFENGACYKGDLQKGLMIRHGQGVQTWPDGTK